MAIPKKDEPDHSGVQMDEVLRRMLKTPPTPHKPKPKAEKPDNKKPAK